MFRTAATKIAHNSTIPSLGGNQPLQDLITTEKALLLSLQKLSLDFSKASEGLRTWGLSEGDDLGDILGASAAVLNQFSAALSQYAAHGHGMREQLKVIRARDENLDEMKKRRRAVFRKADDADKKLSRMSPESKSLQMQTDLLSRLRDEVRSLDTNIVIEEAALGDFKRSATKTFMGLKFGGLLECCQKGSIAATFGKRIISDISEEKTQPGLHRAFYQGQQKTERIVADALRAVNDVTLTTVPTHDFHDRQSYHNDREEPPFVPAVQDDKPIPIPPKGSSDYPEFTPPAVTFANDVQPSPKILPQQPVVLPQQPVVLPQQPAVLPQQPNTFPQQPNLNPWSETQVVEPPAIPSTRERSSLDDFGILNRSKTGPMDLNNGPGGRFATFPIKTHPAASPPPPTMTFTLDPLPLQISHELGPSFASSIADALEHKNDTDPFADNTTSSNTPSSLLPLRSASIKPAASTNPWADATEESSKTQMRKSNLSDNDEALLAYLMSGDDEGDDSSIQQISGTNISSEEQDQRVREERQGESPKPELLEDKRVSGSPSVGGSVAAGSTFEREDGSPKRYERPPSLETGTSKLETVSLSSSQLSSEEQENALNAAVAREITQELETLNAGWPPLQSDTDVRGRTRAGTGQSYGSSDNAGRDSSPLAPPSAPFARRAVSPHPAHEKNLDTPPGVGRQPGPFPLPLTQPQSNQYSPLPQGLSPSQAYQSYRPHPGNSPLSGTPITERPSPSMNNTSGGVGPGNRTIPAAAFKKPRRMSMDNLSKGLPGSPYPGGTPRVFSSSGILPSSASYIPPSEQFEKRLPYPGHDHYVAPYVPTGSTSGADHEYADKWGDGGYQSGKFATDLEGGLT